MTIGAVLVTGATGFLGRPLVRELRRRGRAVRVLTRSSDSEPAEWQGVEVRHGDLAWPTGLVELVQGVESVIHLAGRRHIDRFRPSELARVNVDGTTALAAACLEARVPVFVHVSTALCAGLTTSEAANNSYLQSRLAALESLRRLESDGLPLVVASPAIVFGPDESSHPNRITTEIRRLRDRTGSLFVDGGRARRSLVYRDDVVEALVRIEALRPLGRELLLAGEPVSHRQFDRMVRQGWSNPRRFVLSLPLAAALAAARVADRMAPGPSWRRAAVWTIAQSWVFDDTPSRQLLGYDPRPFSQGLDATMRHLRRNT